ncbi:MAG TPA: RasGEF domain-containing protein, partial [Parachlamydiaceae bacterium]|nr:RasGEF domain-containing protein [Parachlamydiaceae bacterium]
LQAAKEKANELSKACQKYVFSKPFTKESLGVDKLETKHKVFNAFFVTSMAVLFPVSIPMSAARLCYVAHMENKEVQKGKDSLNKTVELCNNLDITIPSDLQAKIAKMETYDKSKDLTDKPFIKANNEVLEGLSKLIVTKRTEVVKDLVKLGDICKDNGFLEENESLTGGELFLSLKEKLSESSQKIIEGETKENIPLIEVDKAVKELKAAMEGIPELKEAMPKLKEAMPKPLPSIPSSSKPLPSVPSLNNSKSLTSLEDIKPLSKDEIAKFTSSGNAMRDFIQTGAGFEEADSGGKEIDAGVNIQNITLTLGVIYNEIKADEKTNIETGKEQKSTPSKALDNALSDLEELMVKPEDFGAGNDSSLGSLAQMSRVLDLTISMFDSKLYGLQLKADLDKGNESKIQKIFNASSEKPELQAQRNKLEKLIADHQTYQPAELKKSDQNETTQFNGQLDLIRTGNFKKEIDEFAKNMALDSRDVMISLTKEYDPRLLSKNQMSDELGNYFSSLEQSVVTDILKGSNGKEIARSIAFYAKVAKYASEAGDHNTANTIATALAGNTISRLRGDNDHKAYANLKNDNKDKKLTKSLEDLNAVYTSGTWANYNKLISESTEVQIPVLPTILRNIFNTSENYKDHKTLANGEKIPNTNVIVFKGKTIKDMAAVAGLQGGKADRCPGFTSILTQFEGQDIEKIKAENDNKSKGLRDEANKKRHTL